MKVTIEKTSRHSILWKIDCDEDEGELAVQRIDIDFVRRSLLKKNDPENEVKILKVIFVFSYFSLMKKMIEKKNTFGKPLH